jgi:photosystem I reaction center subunit XII
MEVIFQLAAIFAVVTVGPAVIVLLAAQKGNLLFFFLMNISDSQVFIALYVALFTGIIAFRLGISLYEG